MSAEDAVAPAQKGRLVAGASVFALGWIATLAMAWAINASALPSSIVPIVVFVGPKIGALAAVAIMGKPGFAYLKTRVFGYLKPPAEVSPARHRVGIVMFVAALLFGWLEPYGFLLPGVAAGSVRYTLAVDLLLVASLFVLGGDFWDKIRALFVRDATVRFPTRA